MDHEHVLAFGDLLRRYRLATGLTQEELAGRAGVSPRGIGDIERGVSRAPHRDTVLLLADALGLTGNVRAGFEATARRRAARFDLPSQNQRSHALDAMDRLAQPAPSLVGRASELGLVERHLLGDGSPILILAGEPGIGKTRLLTEESRWARSLGWCVLEGGCQRRGSQEPFAPLLGALAGFLHRRTPAELCGDLVGCAWLVRLLPELADAIAEPLPALTLPPDQERRLMFAAVARLLTNVARRYSREDDKVLLVLDDLQWAGSDALDLLDALIRQASATAVSREKAQLRVVGAYRDTEVRASDRLAVALADWAHAGLITHRALPPLPPDDCGRLLDELLADSEPRRDCASDGGALRERVLQRSGGVPFFVVSYAQALRHGEVSGGVEGVPWDVAQSVRQRVAALPESARALLGAAAVIGRVTTPALLMSVLDRSEEEVLAGLAAACEGRLLIDAEDGYYFAHDLVREVAEADLGSARRAALHRRTAAAIEKLYANRLSDQYETLAEHYLRGEAWEDALRYLVHSGDKAVGAGAIREALRYYEEALVTCARLGAPAGRTAVEVAEKRAFVCYDSANYSEAIRDFARMCAVATELGDRRLKGLALAYGGMAAYYAHDFDTAERLLTDAIALAGDEFEDVRLFASIQLGSQYMITSRHVEAQPLLRAAEELVIRVDDPLSRAWWAITGSEVLHWRGHYHEALVLLDHWKGAVTDSNQLLPLLWTRFESAVACGGKGEYARALTLLDEAITACASTGETFIRARCLNTAGWIRCELQDHERAMDLNRQCLALVGSIETADTEIESNGRLNLADSLLALGRLDEAEEQFQAVEHIVRKPRPTDNWMIWRYSQHLFHSHGELWLARGDLEKALSYADECLSVAEATDSKRNIAKARRLRGQAFLARGDLAAAETELATALDVACRLGNPPQRWKTLVAIGDLRRAQGDSSAAELAYAEALAIVEAVAAQLPDARQRQIFVTSPHVEQIRRRR